MSIGFKKLEELIDEEIDRNSSLSSNQNETLARLCKKIYMFEAGQERVTTQTLVQNIKGEIANVADSLSNEGDQQ